MITLDKIYNKAIKTIKLASIDVLKHMIFKKPNYDKKYNLVICGIFKDEAPFLKEWVTYHHLLGVEHFYLYNNNSTDDFANALDEFIKHGIVTLIDWPIIPGQLSAYSNFYKEYAQDTQWVSFLDIDEFIVPRKDTSIIDWLKRHDKYPIISMYWKMFGSNGQLKHDLSKLVTEQYVSSWQNLYCYTKSFFNTDYIPIMDISFVHEPKVNYTFGPISFNMPAVNCFNRVMKSGYYGLLSKKDSDKADVQINHYWSKAWDSYSKKRQFTSDVMFKKNPKKDIQYFLNNEYNNTSIDMTIFRFLLPLKWRMNGIDE